MVAGGSLMSQIVQAHRTLLAVLVALGALAAVPALARAQRPAFLGVAGQPVEGGVRITAVVKGSPADQAGLKPGDLIQAIDSTRVGLVGDEEVTLQEALKDVGDVARVTVRLAGPDRKIVKLNIRVRNRPVVAPDRPVVLGVRTRLVEGGALIT